MSDVSGRLATVRHFRVRRLLTHDLRSRDIRPMYNRTYVIAQAKTLLNSLGCVDIYRKTGREGRKRMVRRNVKAEQLKAAWRKLEAKGSVQSFIQRHLRISGVTSLEVLCERFIVMPEYQYVCSITPPDKLKNALHRILDKMRRDNLIRYDERIRVWYSPRRTAEADISDHVYPRSSSVHTTSGGLPGLGKRR